MRTARINYALVGGFVLAMLATLILAMAVLAGRTGATDRYFTHYDNVTGVVPGTQVLYEGYPIGQVEQVEPAAADADKRFRVEFSSVQGWQLPDDSVAQITEPGLLAAITIDIRAGSSSEMIPQGGEIQGREVVNVFSVVSTLAGDFGELVDTEIRPLVEMLAKAAPEIINDLESATSVIDDSSRQVSELFTVQNVDRLKGVVVNFEETSTNMLELSQQLNQSSQQLDDLLVRVNTLMDSDSGNVGKMLEDAEHTLDSIARHIDALNENLEGTSRNMYEFSRQIRQNPSLLLRGGGESDDAASP